MEELLDSQTIDGCRSVFDYLDSRRERITAVREIHDPNNIAFANLTWPLETFQKEGAHNSTCMQ